MKVKFPIKVSLEEFFETEDLRNLRMEEENLFRMLSAEGKIRFANDVGLVLTFQGQEFTLGIYPETMALWAKEGALALGDWAYTEEHRLSKEDANDVLEVLQKFLQGQMRCSKCGEWIPVPAGYVRMYFAGAYCESCWENGMKAIEARETYE